MLQGYRVDCTRERSYIISSLMRFAENDCDFAGFPFSLGFLEVDVELISINTPAHSFKTSTSVHEWMEQGLILESLPFTFLSFFCLASNLLRTLRSRSWILRSRSAAQETVDLP